MDGWETWTIKKTEPRRTDAFKLWCWWRLLRVPWIPRRSNQSVLKEFNSEYSLEGMMLKLKLQYLVTWYKKLMQKSFQWKRSWFWGRLRAGGEGDDKGWDGITDSMGMSLSKLWKIVKDKEAWRAVVLDVAKSQTSFPISASFLTSESFIFIEMWQSLFLFFSAFLGSLSLNVNYQ